MEDLSYHPPEPNTSSYGYFKCMIEIAGSGHSLHLASKMLELLVRITSIMVSGVCDSRV